MLYGLAGVFGALAVLYIAVRIMLKTLPSGKKEDRDQ